VELQDERTESELVRITPETTLRLKWQDKAQAATVEDQTTGDNASPRIQSQNNRITKKIRESTNNTKKQNRI
jgi:hypothetical protein